MFWNQISTDFIRRSGYDMRIAVHLPTATRDTCKQNQDRWLERGKIKVLMTKTK